MKGIERLEETVVSGTKSQRSAAAYQLYWIIRDGDGTITALALLSERIS